jgi:regulator of protease activity HflC (stomatin/prohibitin superfamily)
MVTHETNDHSADTTVDPSIDMPAPRVAERVVTGGSGGALAAVGILIALIGIALWIIGVATAAGHGGALAAVLIVLGVLVVIAAAVTLTGLTSIMPGQARVVQLFGRYVGTVRRPGLRWFNPFTKRRRVSTRIRNHETAVTKVNDADGNPIEIAAVVVWQVSDTARALYEVDDFVAFVNTQTETAVRHIATSYPYDSGEDDTARTDSTPAPVSLRQNSDLITEQLSTEIAARVESAGVHVIESRLTRLAYAPEIAQAMLRRQQASAVVAARQRIVEGAVGMVRAALAQLDEQGVVDLDEERKATMVSNLLVVLCGDRDAQPVVNTGSLYQ